MATGTTRFISKAATGTATIMSVASAGNLMALAKQIQFMDLTTNIDGCPKVYADYIKSMAAFNLDLGWLMPDWMGGMGPEAMARYKHKVLGQIKVTTVYCHKFKHLGKGSATSYLKEHTEIFAEMIGLGNGGPAMAPHSGTEIR